VKKMSRVLAGWAIATRTRIDPDAVVRANRTRIFRLALAITGSTDSAEDVTQDVSCRIARSFGSLQIPQGEWSWIRSITVRCAAERAGQSQPLQIREEIFAKSPDPDQAIAVAQVLARLTTDHRTALALHVYEGMTYQEIAETLGISIGTVSSRIFHAKQRFRELWEMTP
jgi:RNA polymerase sigma-70 factor (ECF subfamily)